MLKVIHRQKCKTGVSFRNKIIKVFSIISGIAVLGSFSISSSSVYADTTTSLDLTANVAAGGLSITLPSGNSATLNLAAPYSGPSTDSKAVTINVQSSQSGYKLLMAGNSNLTKTDSASTTIPSITNCSGGGCSISDNDSTSNTYFPANHWGFSIGAGNTTGYQGLNTTTTPYFEIGSENTTTSGKDYVVNFGAKVDYSQAVGVYTNTINFIAVANVTTITMQSMSEATNGGTLCSTGSPTLVTDSRDNKQYLVQRLADGKCWMLDNLALDPTNETTKANITESTTNADANTIAIFKQGFATAAIDGLNNSDGKYATSGVSNEWGKTIGQNDACPANANPMPEGCTDNWTVPRVKTEGKNTNTTNYINIDYNMNSTAPVTYGDAGNKIGVWYNYCAASMGSYCYPLDGANNPTSNNNGTRDIEADICPTGWSLPTGGGNRTETSTSELIQLYRAYGPSLDINNNANNPALKTALSTPLSGGVYNSSGAVVNVGANGGWGSSTRGNTNGVYNLYMNASSVNPAYSNYRSNGFSIRCVLR